MKTVVNISLGSSDNNLDLQIPFLGERVRVVRLGVNDDIDQANALIKQWDGEADVIALGRVRKDFVVGTQHLHSRKGEALALQVKRSAVTTGEVLRDILQEWSLRHAQIELKHFFDNAKVLFFSGIAHYKSAQLLSEYTQNLTFADTVLQLGVPKFLTSLEGLERFAQGVHPILDRVPAGFKLPSLAPFDAWTQLLMRRVLHKTDVVVASYEALDPYTRDDLEGKVIVTSSVSDSRLEVLRAKGVSIVIDSSTRLAGQPIGAHLLEALIIAVLGRPAESLTRDDFLEIIQTLDIAPRILYPQGFTRTNRFAFVIHPLSQRYLTNAKPLEVVAKYAPKAVMNVIEKLAAYTPPFVYSHVTGIRSPTGVEAEGWLITVGGTPKEIMSHSPEFTYRQLLAAAEIAKKLGAQIMGLGAFTKVVGDAGVTVARRAPLPITTGNSYSASGALWAASDAVQRLGLVSRNGNGKWQGHAMVVGATGAIGSVCARLLAKAVDELHLVSPETAKLLALKETILQETPDATLHMHATPDKVLGEMDMIVTATSGAGKRVLDIMKVKPGCVITDVARPLDIPADDVAKRPDVLVIESGEIELPGDVHMKNIGLPKNVAYACLAETIVLTLEGRFENFTLGRNIEWEKVKEIYQLGLKHGMKLASISGVNGVYSDADLQRVRTLALAKKMNS